MARRHPRAIHASRAREERNRQIYTERVIKNRKIEDVAKQFGVSQSLVNVVVREQEKNFVARHDFTVEAIKQDHSERLERLISECLEQWDRSKKDSVTVQETVNSALSKLDLNEGQEPPEDKTVTTTKGQCGDVSYLLAAAKFMGDIRKIWGADEPAKLELTGNVDLQGSATPVPTREELQARIDERIKFLYGPPKKTIVVDAQRQTQPADPKSPKIPQQKPRSETHVPKS